MSLRTHCMVEPGKGRQLLYKLIQYLRQEGRSLSIFSCCSWASQWLCAEVFPHGKWSLQLSQQWAYRPYCWAQGFLQVKTKTYKEVMSWGPGRQHSKKQFSVIRDSVQGDLCKVKFCTSQNAREPTRPARNKPVPWKQIALCSHDKILSPAGTTSLRQALEIQAAGGIQIYRHSPPSITLVSTCNDLHTNSYQSLWHPFSSPCFNLKCLKSFFKK